MRTSKRNIFVILSLMLSMLQLNAQFIKQHSRTNSDLNAVCFVNSNVGFVAGFNGVLQKTNNGGRNWEAINTETSHRINAVYFISIDTGFIAGENGVFKKTTDGGLTWKQLISMEEADFTAVQFTNNVGFAVGHSVDGGVFCKTSDYGTNWDYKLINENYTEGINQSDRDFNDIYLMNISFLNDQIGIIGGFKYNFTYGKMPFICKTTNGGKTFEDISPADAGVQFYEGKEVVAINYYSEHEAFAILNNASGTEFLHLSDYRVESFEVVDELSNFHSRGMYYTSAFLSKYIGYFSGIINGKSQIVKTTDQGASFMNLNPPTEKSIYASCFPDINTGFFVGEDGIILKLSDRDNVVYNMQNKANPIFEPPFSIAVSNNNKNRTQIHIYNVDVETEKYLEISLYDHNGSEIDIKNTKVKKYADEIRMKIKTDELEPSTYFYTIKYQNSSILNGKIALDNYAQNLQ